MHSALDVAAWFLNEVDRKAGDSITSLKLQKLVYYAQAWAVALLGRPLFEERVEAWAHGPVVDVVYQEYKDHGFESLPRSRRRPRFAPGERVLLEDVMAIYGEHSARFLETLTHGEQPWRTVWGDLPATSRGRREIPLSLMREFYLRQYENREEPNVKVDLRQMRPELLEEGTIALAPLPEDHFPADHDEYVRAVNRDLAARPRRQRRQSSAGA
ncbi:Panacea domain-containing protein [Longimicrobium sp.]|uniref:Panacea domain-containing protein n=1 Tax=Longimicrobium sp. TaxID=2029185 RepID=UPI002E3170CE|nr:type II toxin-antitoxin system antitoxin SocA domain-containing protein [Longimicrobium sp.]HEX6040679.1 type II toxin-antitoxin system antitoxin SocA domain-containing protein [Longimicrobium sp.]